MQSSCYTAHHTDVCPQTHATLHRTTLHHTALASPFHTKHHTTLHGATLNYPRLRHATAHSDTHPATGDPSETVDEDGADTRLDALSMDSELPPPITPQHANTATVQAVAVSPDSTGNVPVRCVDVVLSRGVV